MTPKPKLQILSSLIAVVLLLLAFLPLEYTCIDASDWMADLDDTLPLSALTIPGTHDSGALYSIADVAGKCQSLTVREQLKAGVRFFDIRLQLRGDKLAVVHSFVDQMTDFADVLDDMTDFLRDHPTEFLLVSIKQDADAKNPHNLCQCRRADAVRLSRPCPRRSHLARNRFRCARNDDGACPLY